MAEIKVLDISTENGVKSIRDLQIEISNMKKSMTELAVGSEEAQRASLELQQAQTTLKAAMKGAIDTSGQLDSSYNGMVARMAQLKAEAKQIQDPLGENAEQYKKLSEEINGLNDKLKELDAQNGVYGRNVGNYVGALQQMPGILGRMGQGIGTIHAQAKMLMANPWLALIGAIITIVQKLSQKFKENQAAMQSLTRVFGLFKGVGVLVNKVIDGIADGVVWLADKLYALADRFGLVSAEMKESERISKEQLAIQEKEVDLTATIADRQLKISELRAKSAEKNKYSAKERISMLQEAADLEKSISNDEYELAKRKYEVQKALNAQSKSSVEDMQEEADLYAEMVNKQTAYNNKVRELNAQITEAQNQMRAQTKQTTKEVVEAQEEVVEKEEDLIERQYQARKKYGLTTDQEEMQRELNELKASYDAKLLTLEQFEQAAAEIQIKYADKNMEIVEEKVEEAAIEMVEWTQVGTEAFSKMWDKIGQDSKQKAKIATTAFTSVGSAVGDMLGAVAENFDENSKEYKGLMITQTIISMLTGISQAISQAMQLGPIMGPIMGAINAATVTATGIASIQKIKNANENSSPSGANVSGAVTQSVSAPPEYAALTGSSVETALTNTRVYVTEEDISSTQNKVRVAQSEARF